MCILCAYALYMTYYVYIVCVLCVIYDVLVYICVMYNARVAPSKHDTRISRGWASLIIYIVGETTPSCAYPFLLDAQLTGICAGYDDDAVYDGDYCLVGGKM